MGIKSTPLFRPKLGIFQTVNQPNTISLRSIVEKNPNEVKRPQDYKEAAKQVR